MKSKFIDFVEITKNEPNFSYHTILLGLTTLKLCPEPKTFIENFGTMLINTGISGMLNSFEYQN